MSMKYDEPKRTSDDTYTLIDNPYGYQVNVNSHRPILRSRGSINDLYRRYKAAHNIPAWCPLSDGERIEFERYVIPIISQVRTGGTYAPFPPQCRR